MKWNIELYTDNKGKSPILDFVKSLPAKHRAKVYREIDLLEQLGINLQYPHTRKMQGYEDKKLWELRIKFGSDISRVFYFLYHNNTFVLLHGFIKKSDKTPQREINKALSNLDDYIERSEE